MIHIYVLEDNLLHQQRLLGLFNRIKLEYSLSFSFMMTTRPQEILDSIHGTDSEQVYFLDMDIKGNHLEGIEIAQQIREKNQQASISFITNHDELMPMTFEYMLHATAYIQKTQSDNSIIATIVKVLQQVAHNNNQVDDEEHLMIKTPLNTRRIHKQDVFSIETTEDASHKLRMYTNQSNFTFRGKLTDFDEVGWLVRCHRSFMVNVDMIVEINWRRKRIYLANGMVYPLSRSYVSNFSHLKS